MSDNKGSNHVVSVVLADDHKIVRHGVRALLEGEPDLRVTGEAGDGLEAIKRTTELKPDVLVADISMPRMNGIDVVKAVRKSSPKTAVIILSIHSAEVYILQALEAGALGYVLKESGPEQLVRAIHDVIAGKYYLSPPLSPKTIDTFRLKQKATSKKSTEK